MFTTKAQGMGFGLAACKRLIETHNGTIMLESVGGRLIIHSKGSFYEEVR